MISRLPNSVVISPSELPPSYLMAWVDAARSSNILGAIDTISLHDIFHLMEKNSSIRAMVLSWYKSMTMVQLDSKL